LHSSDAAAHEFRLHLAPRYLVADSGFDQASKALTFFQSLLHICAKRGVDGGRAGMVAVFMT